MEYTPIIVAGIMAAGTIIVQIITTNGSRKAAEKSQQAAMEVFEYRIGALEEKVMKHNNLIERTYLVEKAMDVKTEQIKVINHRLEDLEKKE